MTSRPATVADAARRLGAGPVSDIRSEAFEVWFDPFFLARRTRRLVFSCLLVALAVFGALDVRDRLATGPGAQHMSDFSCYVVAAEALASGGDPYAVANPRGWHYLYPPFLAVLLMPFHRLPLTALGMFWFVANVAAASSTYFLVLRLHGRRNRRLPLWLAVLPVSAVVVPAVSSLQRGQISLVLLFLEMLGLTLILVGRPGLASLAGGVVLAAAAALKLVNLLPAGVLLVGLLAACAHRRDAVDRLRGVAAAGGLLAGLALFVWILPSVALGAERNAAHLSTFVRRVVLNPGLAADAGILAWAPSNVSVLNASRHARGVIQASVKGGSAALPIGPDGPAEAVGLFGFACVLLVPALVLAVRAGCRQDAVLQAACFGLALMAGLLLCPLTWKHQLVQIIPAVVYSARALLDRGRYRLAQVVAAVPAALIVFNSAVPTVAGAGSLGLGLAGWTAGTLALLVYVTGSSREPRSWLSD